MYRDVSGWWWKLEIPRNRIVMKVSEGPAHRLLHFYSQWLPGKTRNGMFWLTGLDVSWIGLSMLIPRDRSHQTFLCIYCSIHDSSCFVTRYWDGYHLFLFISTHTSTQKGFVAEHTFQHTVHACIRSLWHALIGVNLGWAGLYFPLKWVYQMHHIIDSGFPKISNEYILWMVATSCTSW